MNARAPLAKAPLTATATEAAPSSTLSTWDVEYMDRIAAIVRQSKRRADEALSELAALGGQLPSPALIAEVMDRHQRAASDYAADAKAFFAVWERTRGRR